MSYLFYPIYGMTTFVYLNNKIMCILLVQQLYIGFSADPDPGFYLNADPGRQTNADLDLDEEPNQILTSQKAEYIHEKNTLLR